MPHSTAGQRKQRIELAAQIASLYYGDDAGVRTRPILRELSAAHEHGQIAATLYRAQKANLVAHECSDEAYYLESSDRWSELRNNYPGWAEHAAEQVANCRLASRMRHLSDLAYAHKTRLLNRLTAELARVGDLTWGWQRDARAQYAAYVLYVDLPEGQVSFHALERGTGPEYLGQWDCLRRSEQRILAYCYRLLSGRAAKGLV